MQIIKNRYAAFFVQVLLFVYSSFFVSQIFSVNNDSNTDTIHLFATLLAKKNIIKGDAGSKKHTVGNKRLNKRFQPESWICPAPIPSIICKVAYTPGKPLFFYRNGFVPSFLFIAQALRGPPIA